MVWAGQPGRPSRGGWVNKFRLLPPRRRGALSRAVAVSSPAHRAIAVCGLVLHSEPARSDIVPSLRAAGDAFCRLHSPLTPSKPPPPPSPPCTRGPGAAAEGGAADGQRGGQGAPTSRSPRISRSRSRSLLALFSLPPSRSFSLPSIPLSLVSPPCTSASTTPPLHHPPSPLPPPPSVRQQQHAGSTAAKCVPAPRTRRTACKQTNICHTWALSGTHSYKHACVSLSSRYRRLFPLPLPPLPLLPPHLPPRPPSASRCSHLLLLRGCTASCWTRPGLRGPRQPGPRLGATRRSGRRRRCRWRGGRGGGPGGGWGVGGSRLSLRECGCQPRPAQPAAAVRPDTQHKRPQPAAAVVRNRAAARVGSLSRTSAAAARLFLVQLLIVLIKYSTARCGCVQRLLERANTTGVRLPS